MTKQKVNTAQLKDCLKFVIENSKEKKLPFCIWGSHGIGKTEIVAQVTKEMKRNLVVVHLSTQDITDLIGIPYQQNGVQCWSVPKWLHDAVENYNTTKIPNVFFLDEMNRGHPVVHKAMLPFLLDGTLHLHSIGPEDCVIAACNPPSDDYEVNDMTDKALLDRLGHVVFCPSKQEYISFCKSKNLDETTLRVLSNNSELMSVPECDLSFTIEPSRRAIFNVMSIIGKKDKTWIKNRASHIIECYLGPTFRDHWISEYAQNDDELDLEIIKNISINKSHILTKITKTIDGLNTCAIDTVEKITNEIISYINERNDNLSTSDLEWITEFYYLPIIPEEFSSKVFLNSYPIKNLIIRSVTANKILGQFLSKKRIIPNQPSESW